MVVQPICWFFLFHSSKAVRTLFGRHKLSFNNRPNPIIRYHQQHNNLVETQRSFILDIARGGEEDATLLEETQESTSLIVTILQKFATLLWTILSTILKLITPKSSASPTNIRQRLLEDLELDHLPECLQTGTLAEALQAARREARFLLAVSTSDTACMQALLSDEVIKLAERKSKSISPNGSYLLWLEYSQKKRMRILASADAVLGESAPVQNPERLVSYLSDIRKRHRKLLLKRSKRRQEKLWAEERRDKYSESVDSDDRRKQLEEMEAEQKAKQAAEEEARKQSILDRRVMLNDSLPDELESGGILVALRFQDGGSSQRRFAETEYINTVFNWVDAIFAYDREKVSLQTLNGKQKITFDEESEVSLSESIGDKKSIAFRVLLQ